MVSVFFADKVEAKARQTFTMASIILASLCGDRETMLASSAYSMPHTARRTTFIAGSGPIDVVVPSGASAWPFQRIFGHQKAACEAVALTLTVFYRCGYFKAFPKCSLEPTTDLVFLGVGYDTAQRRFYVPEDKLLKLEAILQEAIDSRSISFGQLEKLAGKCTSTPVAVPPAILYTHHMYRQIAAFKCSGGRKNSSSIAVSKRSGLRFETARWSEVRTRVNGAPWYDAIRHVLTITGATDASSHARGGGD